MQGHSGSARIVFWQLAVIAASMLLGACSTTALHQAHTQFYNGDTAAALSELPSSDVVAKKDRLLYWLEKGLFLHESGDYQASNRELLAAARHLDEGNYISASDEGRALLANDWVKRYPGEYSERLWVHSYLMMNFLSLGEYDSAAVEARRALERISEHQSVLEKDNFTRALIALSFEAAGQLNDSYIEYRKLAENINNPASIDPILLYQAQRLGFASDAQEIRQRLRENEMPDTAVATGDKAAFVFVSGGFIPKKSSGSLLTGYSTRVTFPQYLVSQFAATPLEVSVNSRPCDCQEVSSDLGQLINDSLDQRAIKLAAKTVVRAVAKDAVADALGEKDAAIGELARLIFFALEEADVRSWRSLPRHLTLLRIPVHDDEADLNVTVRNQNGEQTISLSKDPANTHRFRFFKLRLPES